MKIDVTNFIKVVDLGEDEFVSMASEKNYFVVKGLPAEHVLAFWRKVKIKSIRGCSRPTKKDAREDGRLRIDWNEFCDYEDFLRAKEKILETIKSLMPDAKVRYRQLGSGFSVVGDYDADYEVLLERAFTDEE